MSFNVAKLLSSVLICLLTCLFKLRWAYFHIHPGYKKFYMDSKRTEAHFFHARTNSIHSDYRFEPPL